MGGWIVEVILTSFGFKLAQVVIFGFSSNNLWSLALAKLKCLGAGCLDENSILTAPVAASLLVMAVEKSIQRHERVKAPFSK